ncbi:G2/mitotic-specific cyclin S13-7-like [Homarus americanus]|uniref:G2/mitotic-specific cyclin S13-7-like n=1 Tax=Homarus americanus TaxID=6706 RepID=UPI001C472309|nr:G2/mitotic-specific cyclin S13-7-like [Homarus americanus]
MDVVMDAEDAGVQVFQDDSLPQDVMVSILTAPIMELLYDKSARRSSLGADSLLDQDFSEEGALESEGGATLTPLETILGLQYADDIFTIMKVTESQYHPRHCMADQPQVTEYMRCTLVHWLIKVNHQLNFGPETVFVAVNLADRFLAVTPLAQDCLQLLGVGALFVAAKMEECVFPSISKLVTICGGMYKHHHFRRIEVLILSKLKFALYTPTSWYFLDHLALKAVMVGTIDRRVMSVSRYVAETCLSSYRVTQYLPSVQAGASLTLAVTLVANPNLSHTLHHLMCELYSPAEREEITMCTSLMTHYMAPFLESVSTDAATQNTAAGHPDTPLHGPQPPGDHDQEKSQSSAHHTSQDVTSH